MKRDAHMGHEYNKRKREYKRQDSKNQNFVFVFFATLVFFATNEKTGKHCFF
jgi:hypothetical protein